MRVTIKEQLDLYKKNDNFLNIERPATYNDGIINIDNKLSELIDFFEKNNDDLNILKFVPASGAATRMFKHILTLNKTGSSSEYTELFLKNIDNFPFSEFIKRYLNNLNIADKNLSNPRNANLVLEKILEDLNYTSLPKGLIPFHKYNNEIRTAFQEHIVEGATYCKNKNKEVYLHFTVGDGFEPLFRSVLGSFILKYEKKYDANFFINFSNQDPKTNTIAVNLDNTPFKDQNGKELYRPAGHGALIKNLNKLNYDIIFIKNIDNVTTDNRKEITFKYKKALGGLLLKYQQIIFSYLEDIKDYQLNINECIDFLKKKLLISFPPTFHKFTDNEKIVFIKGKLHRPIRICGMVKNQGKAGGGPFWVISKETRNVSLQIVESAQIDLKDINQKEVFEKSTHFNPVDIVCGVKNYKGEKFDLEKFVDHDTYFITEKTHKGNPLKALELPGLWNGSMSDWNTLFVEVPLETFTPVKSVNDLLNPEHQQ